MSDSSISTIQRTPTRNAKKTLDSAAKLWFLVTALGQLMFVVYIVTFYYGSAVQGDLGAWNKVLPAGIVDGDTMGNIAVIGHILLAAIITFAGALQLIPQIRKHALPFHRWNGRLYIIIAFLISIAGFYVLLVKGAVGDLSGHITLGMNGIFIMVCAVMAWRYALAGNIATHRRWAIRLFVAVSGVWFFRIGFSFWMVVNGGPVGIDMKTFTGVPLTVLYICSYILTLGVVELYLRAKDKGTTQRKFLVAGGLVGLSLMMSVGIFGATTILWLPRM